MVRRLVSYILCIFGVTCIVVFTLTLNQANSLLSSLLGENIGVSFIDIIQSLDSLFAISILLKLLIEIYALPLIMLILGLIGLTLPNRPFFGYASYGEDTVE